MKIYSYLVFLIFFSPFVVNAQFDIRAGVSTGLQITQARCKVAYGADCGEGQLRRFVDYCKQNPQLCEGIPLEPGGGSGSSTSGTGVPDCIGEPNCPAGGSPSEPESNPELAKAADTCESSKVPAEEKCSAFDDPVTYMTLQAIIGGASSSLGGSGKRACETAQALNAAGLIANLTFARRCRSAAKQCIRSCEEAIQQIEENSNAAEQARLPTLKSIRGRCGGLRSKAAWVLMSVAQNVQAIQAARDCVEHFKIAEKLEKCGRLSVEEFRADTFCQTEHCNRLPFNIRMHDPRCKDNDDRMDCEARHNYHKIKCACERNPKGPGCEIPNNNGRPLPGSPPFDPVTGDPYGDGDMPFQPEDFLPSPEDSQPGKGGTAFGGPSVPGGGGGGGYGGGLGGGSGGGSYAAGSVGSGKGNRRRGKSGSNKSIISGSSSGRSSGGRYGGGYRPNYRNGQYVGKKGANSPFDLRKLLPGAKTRGLAGASKKKMEKAGISSANGLTNWEKVRIRYMDQRRKNSFINKP